MNTIIATETGLITTVGNVAVIPDPLNVGGATLDGRDGTSGLFLPPGSVISIGNGSSFHFAGNSTDNLDIAGTMSAYMFQGDGSQLTNLPSQLPDQTSQSGKFLTTNGTVASWAANGSGTVTSVGLTVPSIMSISGSPVTTSGTLAVSLANESANRVFAGPSTGSATTPTFRALVNADIPTTLSITTLNTSGNVNCNGLAVGGSNFTVNNSGVMSAYVINTNNTLNADGGIACTGPLVVSTSSGYGGLTVDPTADTLSMTNGDGTGTAFTIDCSNNPNQSPYVTGGFNFADQAIFNSGFFSGGATTFQALATFSGGMSGDASGLSNLTPGNLNGAVAIAHGGTGQTNANGAFNVLAPSQTSQSGKFLTTNGTNTSWASVNTGTVTSVAATVPSILSISGSPITTTGTLALSLATQTANKVFAGPTSGGAVAPTFRSLVNADLPANVARTDVDNHFSADQSFGTLAGVAVSTGFIHAAALTDPNDGANRIFFQPPVPCGSGDSMYIQSGAIFLTAEGGGNLPTSDPGNHGQLWVQSGGALMVSGY